MTSPIASNSRLVTCLEADLVAAVDRHLPSGSTPEILRESVIYALMGGGKRLRPMLTLRSAEACGAPPEVALPAAVAVECVHTFSLVHDDLPPLDNDDLRRGRATVHKQFGEALGVLAGDALLNLANQELARNAAVDAAVALVHELSHATSLMIAGQVADTLGETGTASQSREGQVRSIHARKTGALIVAACRMGVISAGAALGRRRGEAGDHAALVSITTYAESLGLMFQITDDLLDVEGTPEQTGKRTRKDAHAGKLTFPAVMGVEVSREEVSRLVGECEAALITFGPRATPLLDLARSVATRTA